MRHTYICTACRLHQRFQARLWSLQQARRGFSAAAPVWQQTAQVYGNDQDQRAPRVATSTPQPSRYGAQNRGPKSNNAPRGRYSGATLQPQNVLRELDERPADVRRPHTDSVRPVKPLSNARRKNGELKDDWSRLSKELKNNMTAFLHFSKSRRDANAWATLKTLATMEGKEELGQQRWFVRAYMAFAARSPSTLGMKTRRDERLPRPSQILVLLPSFGVEANDIWPRVLWRMSRVYLSHQQSGDESSRSTTLQELVKLWNMALRSRLQRQSQPTLSLDNDGSLDWSFLPPIHIFAEILAQQQRSYEKLSFYGVLRMLLPENRDTRVKTADGVPEEYYDYASAALVMVDALRQSGNDVQDAEPFLEIMEVVLKRLRMTEVPLAMRQELLSTAAGGVGREVEGVVGRMGLVWVPPAKSEVKPQRDATEVSSNANGVRIPKEPHTTDDLTEPSSAATPANSRHAGTAPEPPTATGAGEKTSASALEFGTDKPDATPEPKLHESLPRSEPATQALPENQYVSEMLPAEISPSDTPTSGYMLYAYEAAGDGELSVAEGQSVEVLEHDDGSGWIGVKLMGLEAQTDSASIDGFVPASYVDTSGEAVLDQKPEDDGSEVAPADIADKLEAAALPELPTSQSASAAAAHRDALTERFVNGRIALLGSALQRSNLPVATRVREEVLRFSSDPAKPPLPDKLYEHLMLTLLSLRSLDSAIEVWNHFIGHLQRQPTAKTYTVMMRGAQNVRDIKSLEAFWTKMRGAGIQPDVHAWSVKVYGLIRAGKVENGLRALQEMGQEWVLAARQKQAGTDRKGKKMLPEMSVTDAAARFEGDVDGVPKPNSIVMNAAVSALASRADEHIDKVLAWGRAFGLVPDRTTYNVLLNLSMRHGNADEALEILKRMEAKGIETDSTTWTILLTDFFEARLLDDLDTEEMKDKVLAFIDDLTAASKSGIDSKGYALVIDRLLKRYDNTLAANAVLAHMIEAGVAPTTQIYTILMSSYFQAQPPDFAAAEALWRHIQSANEGRGAPLDGIFYDRMIEGYAVNHHLLGTLQPMLHFLDLISEQNRRASWRALEMAARALADRGMWDRLLRIVDEARRVVREGESDMLVGRRAYGQRGFWAFIVETGMLSGAEEELQMPEQFMRRRDGKGPLERRLSG